MTFDYVRVSKDLHTVTYTCSARVALTGCQFTWRDNVEGEEGPLLDLSRGSLSQANSTHLTKAEAASNATLATLAIATPHNCVCSVSQGLQPKASL